MRCAAWGLLALAVVFLAAVGAGTLAAPLIDRRTMRRGA